MSGVSGGGGDISGGASGDAKSGGNTNTTIGGFNAPKLPDPNMKYYVAGGMLLGLVYILKKKK